MDRHETDTIIQDHIGYAMAAAAIPVPLVDIAAVTLVQLDMAHGRHPWGEWKCVMQRAVEQ